MMDEIRKAGYQGSIKLSAIGDALGWITEFENSINSIVSKYKKEKITKYYDWKKYVGGYFYGYEDEIQKGAYSDDTQLLLAVARSIQQDGSVDNEYFSKIELPAWLSYSRGAGRTIKNAARKIQRKSATWNHNFFTFKVGEEIIDYRDCGANGAAMRVLPIALANFRDMEKIKSEVFFNSIITHGHPRAIIGAILYSFAINKILEYVQRKFDCKGFLAELEEDVVRGVSIERLKEDHRVQKWLLSWNKGRNIGFIDLYRSVAEEARKLLRDIASYIAQGVDDDEVYAKLGCLSKKTKSSGISTVVAGIYVAAKYFAEPIRAIEIAVNKVGSDTDSIAAFVGGLLGALHGQAIIPEKWKAVQDCHYLEKVSEVLFEISSKSSAVSRSSIRPELINKNGLKELDPLQDNYEEDEQVYFRPLGKGTVTKVDRKKVRARGKYVLIVDVNFEIGQSCRFSRLFESKTGERHCNAKTVVGCSKLL